MLETTRYQFIANALNGENGFSNGEYLVKYPREQEDKFTARKEIAFYENYLSSICNRFAGYISKKSVQRNIDNTLIKAFIKDCDWRGNSIDVFWQSFIINSKARGSMLLLIDMPKTLPGNQQEQQDNRLIPFLVRIYPESIIEYKTNERGLLQTIKYSDQYEIDGKLEEVQRIYNETSWFVVKAEKIIDQGDHNLGLCPVLLFSEDGDFPSVGEFAQIADISKRLYNMRSELDEMLRNQTFNMLTYHIPPEMAGQINASEIAETVGTNNMMLYYGDQPGFVSPSADPAKVYMTVIEQLVDRINKIGYTIEQPAQAESGIALTIRFQALNSSLMLFSERMEDIEKRALNVVKRWLNVNDETEINWPKDYALSDIGMELDVAQNMQSIGAPQSYINEKLKQIINLDMPTLGQEETQQLFQDIDERLQERDPDAS